MGELEVRRSQQLDGRDARVAGRDEREDEVERGGERLGGEWQRVACLERHAGRGEQLRGEVEIRQRPLKDHRRTLARRPALDLSDDRQQLLFPVPKREIPSAGRLGRCHQPRGRGRRGLDPCLLDARQQVLQPLPEPGIEHRRGRDQVDPRKVREPGQQIEIARPQPVGAGRPVRHGDDHLAERPPQPAVEHQRAQPVFIEPAGQRHTLLVGPEHGDQEAGLPQHPASAPVELGAWLELRDQPTLEGVDRALASPQLVVEGEEFSDQAGAELERWLHPQGQRVVGRGPAADEPLDRTQHRCHVTGAAVQLGIQLVTGQQMREQHRGVPFERQLLERPAQLVGGGARRDEHDRRPAVPPGRPIETTGDRALKRRKVGGVVQPGLSRGDQSNSGNAVQQRVYSLDARARRRSAGSSVENVCMGCA